MAGAALPRAKREGLVTRRLDEGTAIYDLEMHEVFVLNSVTAAVLEACDGTRMPSEIASVLWPGAEQKHADIVVKLALDELTKAHLLVVPAAMRQRRGARKRFLTRRKMLLALGGAAVIAVPTIVTILAPRPAQAASVCVQSGGSCNEESDCCSGICVDLPSGTCL